MADLAEINIRRITSTPSPTAVLESSVDRRFEKGSAKSASRHYVN